MSKRYGSWRSNRSPPQLRRQGNTAEVVFFVSNNGSFSDGSLVFSSQFIQILSKSYPIQSIYIYLHTHTQYTSAFVPRDPRGSQKKRASLARDVLAERLSGDRPVTRWWPILTWWSDLQKRDWYIWSYMVHIIYNVMWYIYIYTCIPVNKMISA